MKSPTQIIKRPLLTEKGTQMKATGGAMPHHVTDENLRPKILFEVALDANKIEIRKAVEALFSVKVADVHTSVVRGKTRRIGRSIGMRSSWKKAVVTLKEGSKIEFFEGV